MYRTNKPKINTVAESQFKKYSLIHFESSLQMKYGSIFNSFIDLNSIDESGNKILGYDKIIYDYFYESILKLHKEGCKVKSIFHPDNMFAVHYYIVGETYKYLKSLGKTRSRVLTITEDGFWVNSSVIFCILWTMIENLEKAGVAIHRVGFPGYCKEFSLNMFGSRFVKIIDNLYNNDKLKEGIIRYSRPKLSIINQNMAIEYSKSMSVEEVFNYVKNYNGNFLKYFKDIESFKKSANMLYEECIEEMKGKRIRQLTYNFRDIDKQLKKERITKKSCLGYLKYLALTSVIQKRVGRPIELTSSVEKKWFSNGYKIMSSACSNLGWKICIDKTFHKGIRSRTYAIRVCFDKDKRFNVNKFSLNNVERMYHSFRDDDLKTSAAIALCAGRYLEKRCSIYSRIDKAREKSREVYYIFNNPVFNNPEKFAKLRENRYNKKIIDNHIDEFKRNFSSHKKGKDRFGLSA